MSTQPVQIVRAGSRELVNAVLHVEVTPKMLIETERAWGPVRLDSMRRLVNAGYPRERLPTHWHWNWERKSEALDLLAYKCYGIECEDQMQGLMLIDLAGHQARLAPDAGRPLVYVEYLESAPWNVVPLTESRRFSDIGTVLMRVAVQVSFDEGFHGRVGLHGLPGAENFYKDKCHMVNCGVDPNYQNLPYFEMTQDRSMRFVD